MLGHEALDALDLLVVGARGAMQDGGGVGQRDPQAHVGDSCAQVSCATEGEVLVVGHVGQQIRAHGTNNLLAGNPGEVRGLPQTGVDQLLFGQATHRGGGGKVRADTDAGETGTLGQGP